MNKDVRKTLTKASDCIVKNLLVLNNEVRQAAVFFTETPTGMKVIGPKRIREKIQNQNSVQPQPRASVITMASSSSGPQSMVSKKKGDRWSPLCQ